MTFIEVRKDRVADTHSKSRRASRAAIICRDFSAARARRSTRTGANRSRSAFREVDAFHVGALIALYERAVGFYGSLVQRQRLPSAGGRSGEKSGHADPAIAAQRAGTTSEPPAKPPRRSRTRSTPTRKMSTTSCDTWRPTILRFEPQRDRRRRRIFADQVAHSLHRLDSLRRAAHRARLSQRAS